MLDAIHPWGKPLRTQTAQRITAELAHEPWQVAAYFRLRSEIFAAEQGLFAQSDRDAFDDHASPIVAQGEIAGMPDGVVGVVRIYRAEEHTWFGGRLGSDDRTCECAPSVRTRPAARQAFFSPIDGPRWSTERLCALVDRAVNGVSGTQFGACEKVPRRNMQTIDAPERQLDRMNPCQTTSPVLP